jgi:hypothetical protein
MADISQGRSARCKSCGAVMTPEQTSAHDCQGVRPAEVVTVPAADLKRVLYALDCLATEYDGEALTISQGRSFSTLRQAMKEAGHAMP